jgi:hypothetical protein
MGVGVGHLFGGDEADLVAEALQRLHVRQDGLAAGVAVGGGQVAVDYQSTQWRTGGCGVGAPAAAELPEIVALGAVGVGVGGALFQAVGLGEQEAQHARAVVVGDGGNGVRDGGLQVGVKGVGGVDQEGGICQLGAVGGAADLDCVADGGG